MKLDEQDFDVLRDLINEALQANWEYDSASDDGYNLSCNQLEGKEWIEETEKKLWEKFDAMREAVRNRPLHDIIKERNNK